MMAPIVAVFPLTASFTASTAATPVNTDLGTVTVLENTTATGLNGQAAVTSVSELTPVSSFGGQIVTIAAGPGGVFGEGVYAITRGPGDNTGAVNNPGVIYRVDPATGKASVFFDLNSVISQLDPGNATPSTPAANGLLTSTGLVNWYSITFDSEGIFSGTPAMFVSSVSRSDPNKNIIFEIAPNGTLMGVFTQFTDGLSSLNFNISPTAILVPPVQDQAFLSGLIGGSGISSVNGTFAALYFQSSSYSPGQVISNSTLPTGVSQTDLGEPVTGLVPDSAGTIVAASVATGPIVGLTAANANYTSPVYSIFTDFGTPAAGNIPSTPGFSGIQGSNGDLLIGGGSVPATLAGDGSLDNLALGALTTPFRRFESIAFDQFGYFSQGVRLTPTVSTIVGGTSTTTFTVANAEPSYQGSLFVSDLASGLYVTVTPLAPLPTTPIIVPVQGTGFIGVTTDASGNVIPITTNGNSTFGSNDFGGRILRVLPNGTVNVFAYGFDTSAAQDYTSFVNSSLTISFSADGTTLYASDDDAIWQFKTTADLADSTSGTLVGLNDLRTLGVPYDGQDSAVDVVDTGVDATVPSFRGRVAPGTDIFTGGLGNMDLASTTTSTTTGGGGAGGGAGGAGGTGTGGNTTLSNTLDGHGTPVAGVIAQFVPQATIVPVDIFVPFIGSVTLSSSSSTGGSGSTGGGAGGTGGSCGGSTSLSGTANALTSTNLLYNGLEYVIQHPFVNDPLRPGKVDRVVAASFAFGTTQTFATEVNAYQNYPQIVIALKNAYHKFLKEGIAPIAAAGEFGSPLGEGAPSSTTSGGAGGTGGSGGTGSSGTIISGTNNADNSAVGDSEGISLPAVLNEVISVTGVYSFPYDQTPASPPTDQVDGVLPNPQGPVLLLGASLTIGGTASTSSSTGGTGTGTGTTGTGFNANAQSLAAADFTIYANRIVGSTNRSDATDFAAPALNVPTFRRVFLRSFSSTTTSGTTSTVTNSLTFTQAGTSLSAAIVTGAYSLVSSALNYWTNIAKSNGYTDDAYLTTPVGVDALNFGKHAFSNLSAWNTPSGINGILAWTAVPAADSNDGGSVSTPPNLPGGTTPRSFATVNVANAIAAIEGYEAIHYLTAHNDWRFIDTNHDKVITAQELTNFVDSSAANGMPEAGAAAALLGGTDTYGAVEPGLNNEDFNENPDDPAAEQRRFNFFDFAADGQLNGSVTINEYKMLGRILLPSPDAFAVTDRQRASANGFLLNPTAKRNFVQLQRTLPGFQWVSAAQIKKYRNVSPAQFGVDQNVTPGQSFPLYTLFDSTITTPSNAPAAQTVVAASKTANVDGTNVTVNFLSAVPSSMTSSNTAVGTTNTASTGTPTSTTPAATTATTTATTSPAPTSSTPGTSGTTVTTATNGASGTSATQALITAAQALAAQNSTSTGGTSSSSTTSGTSSSSTTSGTFHHYQHVDRPEALSHRVAPQARGTTGRPQSESGLGPAGSLRRTTSNPTTDPGASRHTRRWRGDLAGGSRPRQHPLDWQVEPPYLGGGPLHGSPDSDNTAIHHPRARPD